MTGFPIAVIDLIVDDAAAIRYLFLSAHYRSPVEVNPRKIAEARKALRRLALACEPSLDGPPLEIVRMVADDLNTPGALAQCHVWRKSGDGRKLFAALRFLGFWDRPCIIDELKTLPPGHEFESAVFLGQNDKEFLA